MSRFPMTSYPDGWYSAGFSSELAVGESKALKQMGQEFVLFRGQDGQARLLDAHCPHLGAHLGHGGKVVDNALQCPFHAWEFGGDGRCRKIPYAQKIPSRAGVKSWPVQEKNGMILFWYHHADADADWEVEEFPQLGEEGWTPMQTMNWTVRTHVQEIGENGVDAAHLSYVHGTTNVPETELFEDGFVLRSRYTSEVEDGGVWLDAKETVVERACYGLGLSTLLMDGAVRLLTVASRTPIDEEQVLLSVGFTLRALPSSEENEALMKRILEKYSSEVGQDIRIWEHKAYADKPMLCDGDGPIGQWRRFARQFYPA